MQTADGKYMQMALAQASEAVTVGEIPVGAVLVNPKSGSVIARAYNQTEKKCDPTAHAEIIVLREAGARLSSPRLPGLDLYVTLEPCTMCAAAISFARIRRLVFGAYDPKGGGIEQGACFYAQATCHHRPEVIGGVYENACAALLKDFFKGRR